MGTECATNAVASGVDFMNEEEVNGKDIGSDWRGLEGMYSSIRNTRHNSSQGFVKDLGVRLATLTNGEDLQVFWRIKITDFHWD